MELILVALALVGGWTVAAWVGVVVVVAFFVTLLAETALRLRSPRARILRQIARELVRPAAENSQRAVVIHDDHVHVYTYVLETQPVTDTEE